VNAGEDPGPIAYSDAATQRALERLLADRAGPKGMEELERAFQARTGREPDRVNPVLGRLGRASPDRDFYQALEGRLVELYPLPPDALPELAAQRAGAIVQYLVGSGGIDSGRAQSGEVRAVQSGADRPITAQLGLDVVKAARETAAYPRRGTP
jgi:hypothetical protein